MNLIWKHNKNNHYTKLKKYKNKYLYKYNKKRILQIIKINNMSIALYQNIQTTKNNINKTYLRR